MRVWPVLLDARPPYVAAGSTTRSLLLAPLGTGQLIHQMVAWLGPASRNAPLVLQPEGVDSDYEQSILAACPSARVIATPAACIEALGSLEPSDVLALLDARCLPLSDPGLADALHEYAAEPRVALHFVGFETALAGTKERLSFDATGRIRGIVRHYDPVTWPFISGVAATLLPVASGALADGVIPASLTDLRQLLCARGVPSRDLLVDGGTIDLTSESGLLMANERTLLRIGGSDTLAETSAPILIGTGHRIHGRARLVGTVVVHADAEIGDQATVLGPAVIGARARIEARAVVAHAVIGEDCEVTAGRTMRDRAWFGGDLEPASLEVDESGAYSERLHRLRIDRSAAPPTPAPVDHRRHLMLKRALDIAVSAVALLILTPVLIAAAILVRLDSAGPIFYGDKREGRFGRGFRCWKFRTMCVDAHAVQTNLHNLTAIDGPHFKLDRDPRVTRVGRFLRASNLDELPQLFNVLVGEMSLVGPRPSPFRENQVCVPWREARLSVRPGITGMWQVCRHDRDSGDFHQWIEYDLMYVRHLTIWLDLKILVATLITAGGKTGHMSPDRLLSTRAASPIKSLQPATQAQNKQVA
jgi:lipopolysaccharide/colanic/teichoic acid biosynthesis glycosyltransferase